MASRDEVFGIKVTSFIWESHEHRWEKRRHSGVDHDDGYTEKNVCKLCDEAANNSGIPTQEHYRHPKGCKCYWCVFCRCDGVCRRDRE